MNRPHAPQDRSRDREIPNTAGMKNRANQSDPGPSPIHQDDSLSLKTIGDLLGHRTLESTCVYLRLVVDDLRDVALSLPAAVDRSGPGVAS